jgi:hypothetical protein
VVFPPGRSCFWALRSAETATDPLTGRHRHPINSANGTLHLDRSRRFAMIAAPSRPLPLLSPRSRLPIRRCQPMVALRAAVVLLSAFAAGCCCSPCPPCGGPCCGLCNYPCACYPCRMPCCEPVCSTCGPSPCGQMCSSCGQPFYGTGYPQQFYGSNFGQVVGMQPSATAADATVAEATTGSPIRLVSQPQLQPIPQQQPGASNQQQQQPGAQSTTITQSEYARQQMVFMQYQLCNEQRTIQILCRRIAALERRGL